MAPADMVSIASIPIVRFVWHRAYPNPSYGSAWRTEMLGRRIADGAECLVLREGAVAVIAGDRSGEVYILFTTDFAA